MPHCDTRRRSGGPWGALLAAPLVLLAADGLRAETLAEAIDASHNRNPRIEAARSRASAAREGVAQARAGTMPSIAAHSSFGAATDPAVNGLPLTGAARSAAYDVLVTQPLYDGGRTASAIGTARANATAEAGVARSTEHQTILAGITAYLDVLATRKLTKIHARNVALLERLATAARLQLSVREATRADVAQAEAALAGARAELEAARGNEASGIAAFEETLLHTPGSLEPPPPLAHLLPENRDRAIALSETVNTDLVIARARLDAARHAIDQARAAFMPSVTLQAGYERQSAPLWDNDGRGGGVARVVATIPIYTGGLAQAQERAALHGHAAAAYQVADTMAQVRTAVVRAWSQMAAARTSIASIRQQQAASKTALDGVLAERKLGQRTMSEVVAAQQVALTADTAYEQTTRAAYASLCSVLLLTARLDASAIAAAKPRADRVREPEAQPLRAAVVERAARPTTAWRTTVRE
jgi:outer membrane protein